MTWVVGIGIFLVLLFVFPRQMGMLIAVVVVLVIGLIGYFWGSDIIANTQRSKIALGASYDTKRCSAEHPILVIFRNNAERTLTRVSFKVAAYRPGYSDAVLTDYMSSDRIIGPGDGYASCWSYYQPSYRKIDAPEALRWEATASSVKFQ